MRQNWVGESPCAVSFWWFGFVFKISEVHRSWLITSSVGSFSCVGSLCSWLWVSTPFMWARIADSIGWVNGTNRVDKVRYETAQFSNNWLNYNHFSRFPKAQLIEFVYSWNQYGEQPWKHLRTFPVASLLPRRETESGMCKLRVVPTSRKKPYLTWSWKQWQGGAAD